MNLFTHIVFGILIGAIFFGKPEIMLLIGIGSAIPDLDREYGFLSRESFRRRAIHRALCHNFLFLGMVYIVNPYLGLGAFLHTILDALTTGKDRGVEWLYPFSRLVTRAVYDSNGKRLKLDPKHKIYYYLNEPLALTRRTDDDLKPDNQSLPWRRSYGPALNLALLDQGIFLGSSALTLMLILFSAAGLQQFVELNGEISYSTKVPLSIAFVGGFMIYVGGEIDRWKQLRSKYDGTYKTLFLISVGILIFAIILGALMNPESVRAMVGRIPYIAAGAALSFLVAFAIVKFHSSRPLPTDPSKEPAIV